MINIEIHKNVECAGEKRDIVTLKSTYEVHGKVSSDGQVSFKVEDLEKLVNLSK